ncbi:hypothetical protein BCR44DRAFT_1493895 [Catenaria anguillulae PL171]|uniref:Dihydroorotate dehydrogenase (quinone), mitochondrial n=1 Tax=Catenaria anguillulae PL171 TaxID=765915 RepID=A0A1Y2HBE4_9FUNG|nr:hypothetical protein BCR44DRAFT_1493895 [Catenaria anguillulae PL171]
MDKGGAEGVDRKVGVDAAQADKLALSVCVGVLFGNRKDRVGGVAAGVDNALQVLEVVRDLGAAGVAQALVGIHSLLTMPLVRATVDPEVAHQVAVRFGKYGLVPRDRKPDPDVLATDLWGLPLANPVGLAAGFDKNGEAIDGMLAMGFASVEIGSITPRPQPGNPKPRVFRLPEDGAVINRYGFNSEGHTLVLQRLQQRVRAHKYKQDKDHDRKALIEGKLLGINLGKNKSSAAESHEDYVKGVRTFAPLADYLVVNVSSPNTPGLRALQKSEVLRELMAAVVNERDATVKAAGLAKKVPVCVKIAPDMSEEELRDVAKRPASLKSDAELVQQAGGLSGAPVFPLGLRAVRIVRSEIGDKIPIIGCGGIASGKEALAYAAAGARAVQMYTSLVMDGPGAVAKTKDELAAYFEKHGLTWREVVGAEERGVKLPPM